MLFCATEPHHYSTSLVHVMKMMLTRSVALRTKGYKVSIYTGIQCSADVVKAVTFNAVDIIQ